MSPKPKSIGVLFCFQFFWTLGLGSTFFWGGLGLGWFFQLVDYIFFWVFGRFFLLVGQFFSLGWLARFYFDLFYLYFDFKFLGLIS